MSREAHDEERQRGHYEALVITDPTVADIAHTLAATYKPDGVAMVLAAKHKRLSPDAPLIDLCRTVEGRREVYAWAFSLGEIIAT